MYLLRSSLAWFYEQTFRWGLIALSLIAAMKGVALSVALGVLTFAAATLDVRFRLPPFAVYVQAGVAALLYRSVFDPGLTMAFDANWGMFLIMYLAPIVLLGSALVLYSNTDRPVALAALEGGVTLVSALARRGLWHRLDFGLCCPECSTCLARPSPCRRTDEGRRALDLYRTAACCRRGSVHHRATTTVP